MGLSFVGEKEIFPHVNLILSILSLLKPHKTGCAHDLTEKATRAPQEILNTYPRFQAYDPNIQKGHF